ncbi:MAG TPA: hypothetical protein DC009_06190 [Porphyromonadaceae bacterium]|nr:hypothetical protein [Porphyromonadaceae bacterium]
MTSTDMTSIMRDDYIKKDLFGYLYNAKFPPTENSCKNNLYHGYRTPAQECLFYDFAALGYDLMITYHGKAYYFMVDEDCVWLSDEKFTAMYERFLNGNDVLEHFCIDGTPLFQLVDELDDFEPM